MGKRVAIVSVLGILSVAALMAQSGIHSQAQAAQPSLLTLALLLHLGPIPSPTHGWQPTTACSITSGPLSMRAAGKRPPRAAAWRSCLPRCKPYRKPMCVCPTPALIPSKTSSR